MTDKKCQRGVAGISQGKRIEVAGMEMTALRQAGAGQLFDGDGHHGFGGFDEGELCGQKASARASTSSPEPAPRCEFGMGSVAGKREAWHTNVWPK